LKAIQTLFLRNSDIDVLFLKNIVGYDNMGVKENATDDQASIQIQKNGISYIVDAVFAEITTLFGEVTFFCI